MTKLSTEEDTMRTHPTPKQKVIADFKAVFGGAWSSMTDEKRRREWDNLMRLNEAIGRKVYSNPWRR